MSDPLVVAEESSIVAAGARGAVRAHEILSHTRSFL